MAVKGIETFYIDSRNGDQVAVEEDITRGAGIDVITTDTIANHSFTSLVIATVFF